MEPRERESPTDGQKRRARHALRVFWILFAIGAGYAVFVYFTGRMIPCPIFLLTGYRCPGCGISHLFMDLFRLDPAGAFADNPFIFILLPFAVVYGLFRLYVYVYRPDRGYARWENICIYGVLAAAVLFGIARNVWSL